MEKKENINGKIPLLIIVGPTASGKSDLAVQLAKKLNGEVISADSRQVYKGLDIGTGKITSAEMQGVPHHLLDIADPHVSNNSPRRFTVTKWRDAAEEAIADIHSRGKLPIICGGTGFYIQALVDGVIFPDVPPDKKLRAELSKKTVSELFGQLKKLDPKRAKKMLASAGGDDKNRRRLIRAIEVAMSKPTAKMTKKIPNNYAPAFIGINLPPNILKARIRERLEKRLAQGMIAEVRNSGLSPKRLRELGLEYRYISEYIKNSLTEKGHANESETLTQAATLELATKIWQYSRRQMTWFRRDKRIKWITDKWIADATNQESALLSDLAL